MFNKKNPDKQVSLVNMLSTRYGESAVAEALVHATKAKRSMKIASQLQSQQFENWLHTHKSADDIFAMLIISHDPTPAMIDPKLYALQ
ncbi:uncharacterized protein PITG_11359 [Phytophthora infestans T30-4]|uniref:Uncharacterized protein n=2 Tax=Phytophthora infestans TaxID=4787 RepID=D0NIL6_PHYIT|nr:uncharacterized protein PITG_11359 [Phytophthora infestans T30-4]EEY59350.1 hypothetical protein PITG_11359 [Phytophthora infestans T30-4]KAF4033543.1 hypothetical protein GN244_ATG14513 [Phytophthora infestans]KAF4138787.1 hypothetical protein GN958_ATG11996 [Phytophthora infestans]|eukprot:XP_002900960.1 hypothetical protein PITG_11359 [Phytophthora infestans T30-4]